MRVHYSLKLQRSGTSWIPMLCIGNRRNRRIAINYNEIASPDYWTAIYRQLHWDVRADQIRLCHDLICLIFGVPADRINVKFARKLHNSWRIGKFDPADIYYDREKDILRVSCPRYDKPLLSEKLGVTPWQAWHLLRQSEPKNKIALGIEKAY